MMGLVRTLGRPLALIAGLAPAAAWAHCCCDGARGHHRVVQAERWHSQNLAAITSRICDNYPRSAAHARASGVTWVKVRVGEDGWVEASHIVSSSGRADLDRAALACVGDWHLGTAHDWREVRIAWRFHWVSWS